MKAPNWKSCNEEELWKYVAFHLSKEGVESVLVGGAVVAIYSHGAYRSGDLDLIVERRCLDTVHLILEKLGFRKVRGRHYEHEECLHMIIEFPPGPVSIGDDYKVKADEVLVEGKTIKIFSPTDSIRDRLASYIHFKARECLDQAVLVALNQPFNLRRVREWCAKEGAEEAFDDFAARVKRGGLHGGS